MNETNFIIEEMIDTLKCNNILKTSSIRELAHYFNISHTSLYNMIKNDRITIKFFKAIKSDEILKDTIINDNYIVNKILMGF